MNTQELISKLETMDFDKPVVFDFGHFIPDGFLSWRGDYSEPSMDYIDEGEIKVKNLLEDAQVFFGSTQTGYKGGEFYMNPHDDLWIAHYGRSGNTQLAGVTEEDYQVVLHTKYKEY